MFQFFRRKRVAEMVWQYLDGVIPDDRFALLQEMLTRWPWARQQFVDSAILNALLLAYFNPGKYKTLPTLSEMLSPEPAYSCPTCNLDLDAELEALEAELEGTEPRPKPRRKRPAG